MIRKNGQILPIIFTILWCIFQSSITTGDKVLTRVVNTKYGRIQGLIRHQSRSSLPPVEVYLGVPYASSPVGDGRFTPTSSPLAWDHIKKCDVLPPVCPQPLVGTSSGIKRGSMPKDLEDYYLSFRPILENQSEDCLYLNIYAPHDGGGDYPVLVFIHGDSYNWGSGNMYDGGIIASYGQVIMVIINYRLGPLGFLNTSPGGGRSSVVSNQALMDQLAALSWVQENIASFGGDPKRVTLVGHSTGAACVGFLIGSPVLLPGLFQRAILMSGSAFSPWAEVTDALSVTVRLAKLLNCTVPSDLSRRHPATMKCLRSVSAEALVNAPMPKYKFASVFGPSVDGIVIAENYKERLSRALMERKISLIFGVTEGDAYPDLTSSQVSGGLDIAERNRIFRTFVRNTYRHHLQEIYLAIAKEYTDWGNPSRHPIQMRDLTVEALSDGGFLSPIIRFADIVSSRSDSYMYVFSHHEREHQDRVSSVFRDELPLLFGRPFQDHFSSVASLYSAYRPSFSSSSLNGAARGPSPIGASANNFSRADAIVSEYLMKLWTNFAKTGNPTKPDDVRPIMTFRERTKHKNLTWDNYDPVLEKYLEISSRPRLRDHFRAHKVALWNWLLPELENAGSKYPETESELWHTSDNAKYFIGPVRPLDPYRFLKPTSPSSGSSIVPPASPIDGYLTPNVSAAQGSPNAKFNATNDSDKKGGSLLDYTTALTLTVAIGLSLLVLNVILFAALLYKRERSNLNPKMKYDSVSAQPLCTVDSTMRSTPIIHENITPAVKEIPVSTCQSDPQCTELHSFPTPPDIGDRNTEVTFHTSNSVHSVLSQPTSQFIPPPPLLSTTPPTPPVGPLTTDGAVEGGACGQSRCFSDVISSKFSNGVNHCLEDSSFQYHPDVGAMQIPTSITSGSFSSESSGIRYPDHSMEQCLDSSKCPASSGYSFSSPTSQCPSGQYCPAQFSSSIAQYPGAGESYSSSPSQYSGSPCQYSASIPDSIRYYPETNYQKDCTSSPIGNTQKKGRGTGGTSTLTRQPSTGTSGTSSRKPQPPMRGTSTPSYATLPRQGSKETEPPK